ncbi:hypothetical protein HDU97_005750 [Phlyctochytrium planicorne]|nr:hypothetical protein HDU97_005750 [Phlyctochytrium planicorne]
MNPTEERFIRIRSMNESLSAIHEFLQSLSPYQVHWVPSDETIRQAHLAKTQSIGLAWSNGQLRTGDVERTSQERSGGHSNFSLLFAEFQSAADAETAYEYLKVAKASNSMLGDSDFLLTDLRPIFSEINQCHKENLGDASLYQNLFAAVLENYLLTRDMRYLDHVLSILYVFDMKGLSKEPLYDELARFQKSSLHDVLRAGELFRNERTSVESDREKDVFSQPAWHNNFLTWIDSLSDDDEYKFPLGLRGFPFEDEDDRLPPYMLQNAPHQIGNDRYPEISNTPSWRPSFAPQPQPHLAQTGLLMPDVATHSHSRFPSGNSYLSIHWDIQTLPVPENLATQSPEESLIFAFDFLNISRAANATDDSPQTDSSPEFAYIETKLEGQNNQLLGENLKISAPVLEQQERSGDGFERLPPAAETLGVIERSVKQSLPETYPTETQDAALIRAESPPLESKGRIASIREFTQLSSPKKQNKRSFSNPGPSVVNSQKKKFPGVRKVDDRKQILLKGDRQGESEKLPGLGLSSDLNQKARKDLSQTVRKRTISAGPLVTSAPMFATQSRSSKSAKASKDPFMPGDWICPNQKCAYHNFARRVTCVHCGAADTRGGR